jgi:hypothetical protein
MHPIICRFLGLLPSYSLQSWQDWVPVCLCVLCSPVFRFAFLCSPLYLFKLESNLGPRICTVVRGERCHTQFIIESKPTTATSEPSPPGVFPIRHETTFPDKRSERPDNTRRVPATLPTTNKVMPERPSCITTTMPFVAVRCGDHFLVLARPSSYAELTRRVCDAFALAPVQLSPSAYAHVDDGTVLRCVLAPAQPHPHTVWVVVNPRAGTPLPRSAVGARPAAVGCVPASWCEGPP